MKIKYTSLIPFLILLVVTATANAMPAMDWVQKMSESMRDLSYQGNFVYMHENQLESMSILHLKDEYGEKERLLSLNGEAREVIRDNKNLTCIWPSSRTVVIDYSKQNRFSPLFIPDDIANISLFYDLLLAGKDRVAGHNAVVVHISPKDQLRYGIKLWIAEESGLLVKSSLINELGEPVEQVMFTNLEILPVNHELTLDTMPELDESFTMIRYHQGEPSEESSSDITWHLKEMPGGFRQESMLKRKVSETGLYAHQMVFTDGLASLSVFIEKQSMQKHWGNTSMGAVNAFIRIVDGYSITAIGEVPAVTVQTVAESVFYQEPDK
ncbi:MAG: sigma-E factor negative regulatory protein RseB [Gammaproteobacteria bacterium]